MCTSAKEIEHAIIKRYRKELWRRFTRAINTYQLVEDGDRIAVCISGGKDSFLMAKLFQELKRHGKNNFDLTFLVMNPGYTDAVLSSILENARIMDVPVRVFDSDIFAVAESAARDKASAAQADQPGEDTIRKKKRSAGSNSPCYLCARMRRGALSAPAKALGCNKIALGHHYDDVIETILMGMLYGGQVQTMLPKLHSTNFPGMELIRPMYLIREADIKRFRDAFDLTFIRCACRLTDGVSLPADAEGQGKRAAVKKLIAELAKSDPQIEQNIFKSVENVHLGALVAWKDTDGVRRHFLDGYDNA